MKKFLVVVSMMLSLLALLYVGTLWFLLSNENNFVYWGRDNKALMLHSIPEGFQEKFVATGQGTLQYFEKPGVADVPLVVYIGGNGEHANLNLAWLNQRFRQNRIVTINYPEYGKSTGTVGEGPIKSALLEALQTISSGQPMIIIGRSLGTGFAVWLTTQLPNTQQLVLITPYNRLSEIGCQRFGIFPAVVCNTWMENQLYTGALIGSIHVPMLVVYAEGDRTVPNENTLTLVAHRDDVDVVRVVGSNHNSLLDHPATIDAIQRFSRDF